VAAALLGTPAISLPCGFSSEELPIGMQVFGSHFREDLMLRVAYCLPTEHQLAPVPSAARHMSRKASA